MTRSRPDHRSVARVTTTVALAVALGVAPALPVAAAPLAPAAPVAPSAVPAMTWQAYLCNHRAAALPRLRQGSTGYAVVVLQSALKMIGKYAKRVDGSFGPVTATSVRAFQRWDGIVVDGRVGPQTWSSLQYYVCD